MTGHAGAVVSRLVTEVAEADPATSLGERLCTGGVRILGAGAGSVSLSTAMPTRLTVYATDASAARQEELEETLGEGPATEAYQHGRTLVADLGCSTGDGRWPALEGMLSHRDPHRVVAIPMRPHRQPVGVFVVHRPPRGWDSAADRAARLLADAMAIVLATDLPALRRDAAQTWPVRAMIQQAVGITVAQSYVSPNDAEALLRAQAYAAGTTVADVAERVVGRRLVFGRDAAGITDRRP